MQLERIYWLIGFVLLFIIIALISLVFKHARLQRERYATYGARYRQDKEFSVSDPEVDTGPTRVIPNANAPTSVKWVKEVTLNEELAPSSPTLPKTLCFYVKAKSHEKFYGYDLLQAILNQGFVHGYQDFFHYSAPQGYTLISLTNASAPGTFDLDDMGAFTTTGICLFIQPQRLAKPLQAFDVMVEKAVCLAEELGGVVEDEHHHLLTPERLNDWRSHLER